MSDELPPTSEPPEEVVLEQRAHLRRILIAFVVIILVMPVAAIGGFGWLILPLLLVAAHACREAVRLRRLVRTFGAPRR